MVGGGESLYIGYLKDCAVVTGFKFTMETMFLTKNIRITHEQISNNYHDFQFDGKKVRPGEKKQLCELSITTKTMLYTIRRLSRVSHLSLPRKWNELSCFHKLFC